MDIFSLGVTSVLFIGYTEPEFLYFKGPQQASIPQSRFLVVIQFRRGIDSQRGGGEDWERSEYTGTLFLSKLARLVKTKLIPALQISI